MINSILELSGVGASPVYLPRVDDFNGKGSWQGEGYVIRAFRAEFKTVSDTTGTLYWYDSGESENGESVYYSHDDVFAYWNTGSEWLFSLVEDVGEDTPNCAKLKIPDSIIVSGLVPANGTYSRVADHDGHPQWEKDSNKRIMFDMIIWGLFSDSFDFIYKNDNYLNLPAKTDWDFLGGIAGTPILSWDGEPNEFIGEGWFAEVPPIDFTLTSVDQWYWQLGSILVADSGTYPPADFGDGVTTDLGQTITLDLQGGTGETTLYTFTTEYGTFPIVTRYNFIFAGWYTLPEGQGTRITADTTLIVPEDDDTLYAKWVKSVSGKVGCGASLVSLFALGIGTDIFCEYIGSRLAKTTPQTIVRKLPKP
jgi:hypothetical protein